MGETHAPGALFAGRNVGVSAHRSALTLSNHTSHPHHHAKWVPEILSAQVRVNVRLGLVRGALYWIRPNVLLGLLLLKGKRVCAAVGGSDHLLVFLGSGFSRVGAGGRGQLWNQVLNPRQMRRSCCKGTTRAGLGR